MKNHKNISIPYLECAAIALNLEIVKLYCFEDLLECIRDKFHEEEKSNEKENTDDFIKQ